MSEENYTSIIRELAGSFETGDLDKMLSLFTDNIKYVNPFGTFDGKAEAKRFLGWNLKNVKTERLMRKE
ncbi:MAG: nuclear transport factor 2 family protein [Bacillota bacterium]|nr:nuclear transport factor 2 family protein [Bacillota bacterium]